MDTYLVGDYEISTRCMERYPCKHYVTMKTGDTVIMCGIDIYNMLRRDKLKHSHFDNYSNVSKFGLTEPLEPTDEQIEQFEKYMKQQKEEEKKCRPTFMSASTRLDCLKFKNNVYKEIN